MIPHIHTLFEFISIPYENQHQTLNMKKIDRGQIGFREYSITLLQPMRDYKESVTTRQTHGRTDGQTPDKVIPMCRDHLLAIYQYQTTYAWQLTYCNISLKFGTSCKAK